MFESILCYWSTGHCFHAEPGSHRKIKNPSVKCAVETEHWKYRYQDDYNFTLIDFKYIAKCCFCNKRKIFREAAFANFDYNWIIKYPDIDDEPLKL